MLGHECDLAVGKVLGFAHYRGVVSDSFDGAGVNLYSAHRSALRIKFNVCITQDPAPRGPSGSRTLFLL